MPFVAPATASNPLLEIKNMSVDYYAANGTVHALSDVSITLERGQILGLVGESGSGKSTLAYAITRLLHPPAVITEGEILYYPRPGNPEQQGRRRGATQGSSPSHPAAPAPTAMGTEIGRGATQGSSPNHSAAPAPTEVGQGATGMTGARTEPVAILRLSAG